MKIELIIMATTIGPFSLIPLVSASGPRYDSTESFENIPGAGRCYVDGWDNGTIGRYDSQRARECYDKGDQYNVGFGYATDICKDPTTEEDCQKPCQEYGYKIGLEFSIDQEMLKVCGQPYLDGWTNGCIDANNTRQDCEQLFAGM
jgi:hypothetical protein